MRELERDSSGIFACARLAIVGRGRLGSALAAALTAAGCDVTGPIGRGFDGRCADGRSADAAVRPGCGDQGRRVADCARPARGPLLRSHDTGAVVVADQDRAAYHAAASIASNFLVTLEAAAERIAASAGVGRELLLPLVRAAVENWAELGPERALTGPDALVDATCALVGAARKALETQGAVEAREGSFA
jgi:hypothetical protein